MGAYTWTYIRIDKLNKEQTEKCVKSVIWSNQHTTYGEYSKMSEDKYIKKWLDFHREEYDYFVNELNVPPEQMTEEFLIQDIKEKMKKWYHNQECYQKVLDGKMSFSDMIYEIKKYGSLRDFLIIKRKNHYYVNIDSVFRNYEYCEEEFSTVDSLIKHLEKPECNRICDFTDINEDNVQYKYGPLSDKLRKKIINYYSKIGDGNFIVRFG